MENCKSFTILGLNETRSPGDVLEDGAEAAPGSRGTNAHDGPGLDADLGRQEVRSYRSSTARCNYLAADRCEIEFATKELGRDMAKPVESSIQAGKRMCRFLEGMPRMVQRIPFLNHSPALVKAYVDSDWAACRHTRKSTSGGLLCYGVVVVKGWSSTQAVIALSEGETEYYAALKGASQALGLKSMMADLGMTVSITLFTDSSAAKGVIHRVGLGKLRHLVTGYLWLQAVVRNKLLQVRKVLGIENLADLMTTHLAAADMLKYLSTLGITPEDGRSEAVPRM